MMERPESGGLKVFFIIADKFLVKGCISIQAVLNI